MVGLYFLLIVGFMKAQAAALFLQIQAFPGFLVAIGICPNLRKVNYYQCRFCWA